MGKIWDKITGQARVSPPKEQYYGGSKSRADWLQVRNENARANAAESVDAEGRGLAQTGKSAQGAQEGFARAATQLSKTQEGRAAQGQSGYLGGQSDYTGGRAATLNNAQAMEAMAKNLPGEYQQIADKQAAFNRQQNTRAAVSAASSGGGQLALRNALNASAQANTDAAVQAEMVRAQEMKQLKGMQADMYGQAAGIRSTVGGQDLNRAGLGVQVAQGQGGLANQSLGLGSQATATGYSQQMEAQKANLGARLSQEQAYLGAQANQDEAQLIAARERELAAQQTKRSGIGQVFDPGGLIWK